MNAEIRAALLAWFDDSARDLPWRGCDDPYAVLVSEVMSQQTRVDTVRSYWLRWMEAFPTVDALAAADSGEVMRLWAGLGYYRRARNLHACAQVIAREHSSNLPKTAAELRLLPGIGAYTSAAVASISFDEAVPAVDGNVTRVVSRLQTIGGDPSRAAFRKAIHEAAALLVDPKRPGSSNEALMELGAVCCSPTSPTCMQCPVRSWCRAHAEKTTAVYPPKKARKPPRSEARHTVVALDGEAVFMRLPDGDGLLAGLWEFPTYECAELSEAVSAIAVDHGLVGDVRSVGAVEHAFSHIRMTYHVAALTVGVSNIPQKGGRWVAQDEIAGAALSTAMRRVAAVVPELAKLRAE